MIRIDRVRRGRGFTLIELLIALAVFAILSAIAYPVYTDYVFKVRRKEAPQALLALMDRMERYYADQETYVGATVASLMGSNVTEHGYYTLSINSLSADSYSLHAVPAGTHAGDDCGTFSLTSAGVETTLDGSLESSKCW